MQNRILSQLLLSMLIFTYLSVINAGAQTLSSENTQNGFTGEYGTGTSKLLVEFQVLAQDSTVSRVKDSGGKTFVESTRQGNVITVKIKDVIQTIQMDQSQPENGSVSELSESDLQKLETFRLSPESENVRKLIIELIKQKGNTHKEQLKGFMVMAVVMGDGPGGGLQANSNRGGMGSKWLLNAFQPSKKMSPPNRKI